MKNLKKLNRDEMKNVMGGVVAPPGGGDDCFGTWEFSGPDGCGIINCYLPQTGAGCVCQTTTTECYA